MIETKPILAFDQQFASVELCRRLAELRTTTESAFVWVPLGEKYTLAGPVTRNGDSQIEDPSIVPAYSVAELSELLRGRHLLYEEEGTDLDVGEAHCVAEEVADGGWMWAAYLEGPSILYSPHHLLHESTQADALARLLIHLIERDLYRGALLDGE